MSDVEQSEPKSKRKHRRENRNPIEKRYSNIGWAIFLILAGAVMLLPHVLVPEGFLWIAAGVIMLGYRSAVVAKGVDAPMALVFAGVAFVAIGISEFVDFDVDIFPVLLIVGGVVLLGRAMSSRED